ncbi:MAG: hypothetical protein HFJ17_01640 [Clostridia bacterium]|jgi:hypothetical protein|nr:hypothetical protein [Clostridia bacterium]
MKKASEKQIKLIESLINKKEGSEEIENNFKSTFQNYTNEDGESVWGYLINTQTASELINELFKLNDKETRSATDKQISFLLEKHRKALKGNKKAKTILAENNMLDQVKISCLNFEEAKKLISQFCN